MIACVPNGIYIGGYLPFFVISTPLKHMKL